MNNRTRLLVGLAFILPVLVSCGNKLLVKGLSLPPGSKEIAFNGEAKGDIPAVARGLGGQIDKAVKVAFDNAKGWDVVKADIDGKMKAAGYEERMSELSGGGEFGGLVNIMLGDKVHIYGHMGGRYVAVLTDNSGPLSKLPRAKERTGGGQFTLFVAEYIRDK